MTTIAFNSLNGAVGFQIAGPTSGDAFGTAATAAGDVNGDGIADILFGASLSNPGGTTVGEGFVVFGAADIETSTPSIASLDGANGFRAPGFDGGDALGYGASAAGDVNGDGFDDVIMGELQADFNGTGSGSAYVIFGKAAGFTTNFDLSALDGADGFRMDGVAGSSYTGKSVSGAGDINGDGFSDVIVGAQSADPLGRSNAGEAYVVFGKASGFAADFTLDSLDGADGFSLAGVVAGDAAGEAVSGAGDVNGDGFADIIVGAHRGDPNGDDSAGDAFVLFGKADGFASTIDLANLDGADGFALHGIDSGDRAGRAVSSAGDLNGDGFSDIVIGAYNGDANGSNSGELYVVFGKAAGFSADIELDALDGADGFTIQGPSSSGTAGRDIGLAGDVNGDGLDDLVISARGDSQAFVLYGKTAGFGATFALQDLADADGFIVSGVTGISGAAGINRAGDVNGDGLDDVAIGRGGANQAGVAFGFDDSGTAETGTTGDDAIAGNGDGQTYILDLGNDVLKAHGGNDVANGGSGADLISLGAGNDYGDGGLGADRMNGGEGDDRLFGGGGNDRIAAGAGADFVDGGAGNDILYLLSSEAGAGDRLSGGEGARDTLVLVGTSAVDLSTLDTLAGVERAVLFSGQTATGTDAGFT